MIQSIDLRRNTRIVDLEVDADSGDLWVAEKDRLWRLDQSGTTLVDVPMETTLMVTDHGGDKVSDRTTGEGRSDREAVLS